MLNSCLVCPALSARQLFGVGQTAIGASLDLDLGRWAYGLPIASRGWSLQPRNALTIAPINDTRGQSPLVREANNFNSLISFSYLRL